MSFTTFVNCRLCRDGKLVDDRLLVDHSSGTILKNEGYIGGDILDLDEAIIAPGFIEIQTNGMLGFHFSSYENTAQYTDNLRKVQQHLPTTGVTSFYPTLSTVPQELYKKILPLLHPQDSSASDQCGASILGAHVEGPFLQPTRHGAHDSSQFKSGADPHSASSVYGDLSTIKLATLAPELPGADTLIADLKQAGARVAMGHSSATYEQGIEALRLGATGLTHVFNCMNPLHHRTPGLVGLLTASGQDVPNAIDLPYHGLIADGIHLHAAAASLAYRANPQRAILVTDSTELAGMPDGTYPGNPWLPKMQTKIGNRIVIAGTDTLIGSCSTMDECVRNLVSWSRCSLAEAVKCATQHPADFMGLKDRGRLEVGMRADFVVLGSDGVVLQTWIAGRKVWERAES